ncbi:tRNA lysidine(34) synthetase TilS [Neisseria sp. CCUG12390]|uniref:tRNA lysidine(34) synthetase TilS n=1 Tax=Neisseria sp. CCUG12390 TaxID=3392035 RepID=UPI003A0FE471
MDLLALLEADLIGQTGELDIEVGLSGGLDSVVLLHLLAILRDKKNFKLNAVHVHHGLSPFADEWVEFCQTLCGNLNVGLRIAKVKIDSKGKGIEAAARAERYRVFSDGMSQILALAHHQNDQIETFMLGVARGGGIRALAAIPKWRELNRQTMIWRPLLGVSKEILEQYAARHGLVYVTDESNRNTCYLRNWIRHEALPQWQCQVPNINQQILANVRSIQDDLALLEEITLDDYRHILSDGLFHVGKWRGLSVLRRRRVLHHFFAANQIRLPSHKTLSEMARVLLETSSAQWQFDDKAVEYYRGNLYVLNIPPQNYPWLNSNPLQGRLKDILLENGFVLKPCRYGLSEQTLMQAGGIRKIDGNDKIRLGMINKSVRKLLQEKHILPSVRSIWPVITNVENQCLAVANLTANQDFWAFDGFLPVYEPFERYFTELNTAESVIG